MSVRVDTDWSHRGLQAVVLDNGVLRVVVLPELGGRVWQVTDLRSGRDLLWHNPRVRAARVPFGATYDDVFQGGWDELFPNDAPEVLAGEPYPDHGEVWASAWDWSVEPATDEGRVVMRLAAPISGATLERTVTLTEGAGHLRVASRTTNEGPRALPFLSKQHVAVPVTEPAVIGLGARTMALEDFGAPRAGVPGQTYAWPWLAGDAGDVDMSRTPPPGSGVSEFQYATELDAGWCSLTGESGHGVGLAFDPDVLPSCWLFASYGGWRGHDVLVLEPCTGYPCSVAAGLEQGTHRVLRVGEVLEASITLVAYSGFAAVTGITQDGHVEGVPL